MSTESDSVDAATLLVWAQWADEHQPDAGPFFRRLAKRLAPDVQVLDVVRAPVEQRDKGVGRINPFAR